MVSFVEGGNVYEYRGLSTDTKPENVSNGSIFFSIDDKKVYIYDADNNQWREI